MLSIQEIIAKTQEQRKHINECLDQGFYHPNAETSEHVPASLYYGLKQAEIREIKQTMDNLTLAEVLMKTSTTTGSSYLVAAKLHDTLIYAAKTTDICPLIGKVITRWEGGDLYVNIAKDGTYTPKPFVSGGAIPEVNAQFVQATLSPKGYGVPILAGEDLIEDQQYGIVEWHVQKAAEAVGLQASDLALNVLKTATDGDGSVNTGSTGDADETKWAGGTTADIEDAIKTLGHNRFVPNTIVMTSEAWMHSVSSTITRGWSTKKGVDGYTLQIGSLDVVISNSTELYTGSFTNCKTIIFDRNNALLTGRKRWMEIRNYADPIRDIAGAVVSYRQDSVTLYNDSIYVLTET